MNRPVNLKRLRASYEAKRIAAKTAKAAMHAAALKLVNACPHPKEAMRYWTWDNPPYGTRPGNLCTQCGLAETEGWGHRADSFPHRGDPNCNEIPCISLDAAMKKSVLRRLD